MGDDIEIEAFIAQWRDTGGSELANTQSFINGLCRLIGVAPPDGTVRPHSSLGGMAPAEFTNRPLQGDMDTEAKLSAA